MQVHMITTYPSTVLVDRAANACILKVSIRVQPQGFQTFQTSQTWTISKALKHINMEEDQWTR